MKVLNIIFCGMFILFASLQWNDPDPYVWMPVYLYAALLCWRAAKGKYYRNLYIAGILVYLLYAIYKFFDQHGVIDWYTQHQAADLTATMKATQPWIEETREFFGLLICSIALGINYFYSRKRV